MLEQAQYNHRDDFRNYLREGNFLAGASHLVPLTLALYRLLGEGLPVHRTALAKWLSLSPVQMDTLLNDLPRSTIDFDAAGAITAYGGLSLIPANHRFKIGNKELHTWCVFDALFLPEILDKSATASTRCPATGMTIEIEMTPGEIISSRPSKPVMSIVAPDSAACCENLRSAFCNHINLFVDDRAFRDWAVDRTDVAYVSLEEAHELALQRNRYRYGDQLRAE
jgi:alkylmercury lyase